MMRPAFLEMPTYPPVAQATCAHAPVISRIARRQKRRNYLRCHGTADRVSDLMVAFFHDSNVVCYARDICRSRVRPAVVRSSA